MTIREFAVRMDCNEVIKGTCIVIKDNKWIYEGQIKFLSYENMPFTNEVIKKLEMYCADVNADANADTVSKNLYSSDYIAIIHI